MLNKILFLLTLAFCSANAQSIERLIETQNPKAGHCYVKCLIQNQYETVREQVLIKEASSKFEVIDAEYEMVKDSFLLKETHTVYEFVEPTFATITDSILVEEATKKITHQAAIYETVRKKILVRPADTQWTQSQKKFNCLSTDTADCMIWCLEAMPAEYTEIEMQVLKEEDKTFEKVIPAKYKKVEKIVMLEAAHCVEREVPAEYAFFEMKKIKTPAIIKEIEVPAEYIGVLTKRSVSIGGFTDWVKFGGSFNPEDIKPKKVKYEAGCNEAYSKTIYGFKKVATAPSSSFPTKIAKASYCNVQRFLKKSCDSPQKMALQVAKVRVEAEEKIKTLKEKHKIHNYNLCHEYLRPRYDFVYEQAARNLNKVCSLPPKDAVRTEEFINYFKYDYRKPTENDKHSVALHTEIAHCPWNNENYLLHIGLQAHEIPKEKLPPQNLVLMIETSFAMSKPHKITSLKKGITKFVEQMRPQDDISIFMYGSINRTILPPTSCSNKKSIVQALEQLHNHSTTSRQKSLEVAYKTAHQNFKQYGNNRLILITEGNFNLGVSSDEEMKQLIIKYRDLGIPISVLGFAKGYYKYSRMELIVKYGNGNYAFVNEKKELEKTLMREIVNSFQKVAKDAQIEVEFSDKWVESYRLVGYENRLLENKDFDDDRKDAGDMGSGHSATALYEIVPKKKYEMAFHPNEPLLNIKFRYKKPKKDKSRLLEKQVFVKDIGQHSRNFNFSAATAGFAMLLRDSEHKGSLTYEKVLTLAQASLGRDEDGLRREFMELVKKVKSWEE